MQTTTGRCTHRRRLAPTLRLDLGADLDDATIKEIPPPCSITA